MTTAPGFRMAGLVGALATALGLVAPGARAGESLETAVKAAYLYKFAPFVDWPPGVMDAPGAPLVICVAGTDPFGAVLDRAVAGQRVGDHPIVVRRIAVAERRSACQIMYLGGSHAQSVKEGLRTLNGSPVLTVTDGGGATGVVDLTTVQGHVRFRIDDALAADDGLIISSKLLSLALSVRSRSN